MQSQKGAAGSESRPGQEGRDDPDADGGRQEDNVLMRHFAKNSAITRPEAAAQNWFLMSVSPVQMRICHDDTQSA